MFRHKCWLRILLLSSFAALPAVCALHAQTPQPKALFYLTRDATGVRDFLAHAGKIDILVPTWYQVDANGLVSGGPNPLVLDTAKAHHVPVMPIITATGPGQEPFHSLLGNQNAILIMCAALVRESKANGYTGFQFDFENIAWTDRGALSAMVRQAAQELHRAGLQLSIATVPNAPGAPGETGFSAWIYENWRGAYDLNELAKAVDLICLMTYDQHTRWTMPGPVAGWGWTTENLDYALKVVPPEKLSLGIPLYGYHWYAGRPFPGTVKGEDKANSTGDYIASQDAEDLLKAYGGKLQWDADDRSAWAFFYRAQMREWLFFTDARTFQARYTLVRERGIQGFCSWVLGQEDPAIWNSLPEHK